jgi:Domain of unknown function (DUF4386)
MNQAQLDQQARTAPASTDGVAARARPAGLLPSSRARLAGLFQFLEGTASSQGQVFIFNRFVVMGSAAATAHNILANEFLYRFGFLLSVAGVAFHLTWALLLYQLLKPVHRTVAALAVYVVLICCAMQALASVLQLAPLLVLQDGQPAGGLSAGQAQGLAYELVKLDSAAFQLDLVFFGLWCLLTGYLVWRSTFLPRILGALLMVDGVGWMLYTWPPLATFLFPAIAVASGLAEIPMQAWLLIRGVNNERWTEQALADRIANG